MSTLENGSMCQKDTTDGTMYRILLIMSCDLECAERKRNTTLTYVKGNF